MNFHSAISIMIYSSVQKYSNKHSFYHNFFRLQYFSTKFAGNLYAYHDYIPGKKLGKLIISSPNWSYFCQFAACKSIRTKHILKFSQDFHNICWHFLIDLLILDLALTENMKKFTLQRQTTGLMTMEMVKPIQHGFVPF